MTNSFDPKPRWLTILDIASAVLIAAATALIFLYAPREVIMGDVQKVFYFHVASAWVGMLSFLVAAVASGYYLATHQPKWDIVAMASVEIGMVFMAVGIVSGSIWARPIWNTWWTWDPRLTTTTIMELIYAAYLMLRAAVEDPERRARYGAVYAILGFISVPLTFISIRVFRTIHPIVIGSSDPTATGAFDMTSRMLQTFLFSLFAYSVFYVDLLWRRIRIGKMSAQIEQQKIKLME